MIRRWFRCVRCGDRFQLDVFEPGEAQQKGLPSYPVRCRACGGPLERA